MNEQKIITGLNDLLAKNYDSEKGYKLAAEKTNNPTLAAFYRGKASNRYTYGHQIKDVLNEMEGEIDKGTSVKGDVHRAWINFKNLLVFDKEEAILDEIETGEEACLEEYDEFLSMANIPASIKRIIGYQRNNIAQALSRVEAYEDKLG